MFSCGRERKAQKLRATFAPVDEMVPKPRRPEALLLARATSRIASALATAQVASEREPAVRSNVVLGVKRRLSVGITSVSSNSDVYEARVIVDGVDKR